MGPHPDAFRFMLKKVGFKKSEIIFIDDKMKNVLGARKVGINAMLSKWSSSNKRNSTYYILTGMLNQKRKKKL